MGHCISNAPSHELLYDVVSGSKHVHIDLTIFEYSSLVYDAFCEIVNLRWFVLHCFYISEEERAEIMNLSFYLSLFVTNPNQSIAEHEQFAYTTTLETFIDLNIAKIISSFIIDQSNYLKWTHFEDNSLANQVRYSNNDSIVDFSHSACDFVNVKTQLLSKTKYFVNVYCLGKGDEMWFGVVEKSKYKPTQSLRSQKQYGQGYALFYYGGRERSIKTHGGSPDDECKGWPWVMGECNHGGIQGSCEVIKHPIQSYSAGDWINCVIDMENGEMCFYKNGNLQYTAHNEWLAHWDWYFVGQLDDDVDKFYIEQGYKSCNKPIHGYNMDTF
eukprot:324021_1